MNAFLLQYLPIVIFLGIAAALGIVFILVRRARSRPRRRTRRSCRPTSAGSTPSTTRG